MYHFQHGAAHGVFLPPGHLSFLFPSMALAHFAGSHSSARACAYAFPQCQGGEGGSGSPHPTKTTTGSLCKTYLDGVLIRHTALMQCSARWSYLLLEFDVCSYAPIYIALMHPCSLEGIQNTNTVYSTTWPKEKK